MPLRRMLALLRGLPHDSAVARFLEGDVEVEVEPEPEEKPVVITSGDQFGSWLNKNA